MKKIFILLAYLMVFSGCEDGLEPEIYGVLTPNSFPQTAQDYELYTLEVYKTFTAKWSYQDNGTRYMWFSPERGYIWHFDAPADQLAVFTEWGGEFLTMSEANFAPLINNGRNFSQFEKVRVVSRITKIIGDLEVAEIDENTKNQLLSEAKVARGWTMYYLLHLFGPVPVILDSEELGTEAEADLTRPSREFFVNAIAEDLRFAADYLPKDAAMYGRFNKGLALTLLMRLYMNERDFQNAEPVGREIQAMGYSLVDDYMSLFRESTERNSETIYAISADPEGQGRGPDGNFNAYPYYCLPADYPGIFQNGNTAVPQGGWAQPNAPYMATWEFYDSFDPADERRQMLVDSYVAIKETSGGVAAGEVRDRTNLRGAVVEKYADEGNGPFYGNDLMVARYADVMLMLAEAINENSGPTQEAIGLVNEVRARAEIGPLEAAAVASKDAFNEAILQERGWELFFEGVRKFDLERHGQWPSAVQAVENKNPSPYLYPIPVYAITDSEGKLSQNPGY
ncbi:RagB/SusD family nutrient uptake outer membrane protein [Catalinimonas sp. 4WD22]|uniref:RagB/SusD family nutrient uptake outer membrane protein n=1 Tax=Catalinimonas locisalis TaxID=3133978 RepID=UPI003100B0D9